MLRYALCVGVLCWPIGLNAESGSEVRGKWTVDQRHGDAEYVLASSGATGDFLVCFEAGTVHTVEIAVGDEQSRLARGACTVFAPTPENGIVLDTAAETTQKVPAIALGTFRVIRPVQTTD